MRLADRKLSRYRRGEKEASRQADADIEKETQADREEGRCRYVDREASRRPERQMMQIWGKRGTQTERRQAEIEVEKRRVEMETGWHTSRQTERSEEMEEAAYRQRDGQ